MLAQIAEKPMMVEMDVMTSVRADRRQDSFDGRLDECFDGCLDLPVRRRGRMQVSSPWIYARGVTGYATKHPPRLMLGCSFCYLSRKL